MTNQFSKGRRKQRKKDLYLHTYGLLSKCEVKMAGYLPSSSFACFSSRSINTQKKDKERGQYPAILPNKLGE